MHWRHEQLSLRMALVTASHHSFDKVHAEHAAPRSQRTGTRAEEGRGPREARRLSGTEATSPGDAAGASRGGVRGAVSGSHGRLRGCPASSHLVGFAIVGRLVCRGHRWSDPLVPPQDEPCSEGGGRGGGGAEEGTVLFFPLLTLYSLRLSAGLSCQASLSVWTRRTFSNRACRRLRQWHKQGWFCWLLFALCSFLLSTGPRCFSSWPVWTRRTVLRFLAVACARLVLLVILHLALSLFPSCCQAQMLGIIASKDQSDSYVARFWPTWWSWSRLQQTVDFRSCSSSGSSAFPSWFTGSSSRSLRPPRFPSGARIWWSMPPFVQAALTVTRTAPRVRPRSTRRGFSGARLPELFPYSALSGSTVDACSVSVYEAFWRFSWCGTEADSHGPDFHGPPSFSSSSAR